MTQILTLSFVQVARANLEHAGLSKKVEILVGPAAESLAKLKADLPYDLVFIDADKISTLTYFLEAKRLVRKGGVVVSIRLPSCPISFVQHQHLIDVREPRSLIMLFAKEEWQTLTITLRVVLASASCLNILRRIVRLTLLL